MSECLTNSSFHFCFPINVQDGILVSTVNKHCHNIICRYLYAGHCTFIQLIERTYLIVARKVDGAGEKDEGAEDERGTVPSADNTVCFDSPYK